MAGWIKMPLGTEVGIGPGDSVRWGPSSPPKKGTEPPPQFSAHVHCGQTAGWIKTALGTEVGPGPGHIVLDGDAAPLSKKAAVPLPSFRPISIVAKRLHASKRQMPRSMKVGINPGDFVLDGDQIPSPKGGPQPRRRCVRWGPNPLPKRGRTPVPNFRPMSTVAKG